MLLELSDFKENQKEKLTMPMWFNEPKAREQLLRKGRVYTLRSKPHRGKEKKTQGTDVLMYDTHASRGQIRFAFLKTIKSPDELREYQPQSGFSSVEEWMKAAKKSKHLFLVKLVDWDRKVKYP